MRFRGKLSATELTDGMFVTTPANHRGNWHERFGTQNKEIHLEIGMGRGEFII